MVEHLITNLNSVIAPKYKEIKVYTDGGSKGNPGPAGCGIVIKLDDKTLVANKVFGELTNNEAEYLAVKFAINELAKLGIRDCKVEFFSDSNLVINQLAGAWKIKKQELRELRNGIIADLQDLNITAIFTQLSDTQSTDIALCDKLYNKAMKGQAIHLLKESA